MKRSIRLIALVALSSLILSACSTSSTGDSNGDSDGSSGSDAGSSGDAISAGTTTEVVAAANAFLALLDDTQKASVVLTASADTATVWSNLPTSLVERNGLSFDSLTDAQLAAAETVLQTALGVAADEGYSEVTQIRAADDILASTGGTATSGDTARQPPGGSPGGGGLEYGGGLYYLAFLGTPSTTDAWQLQFGGHHLAVNINYNEGNVIGATPEFRGLEPKCWSVTDGTTTANDCAAPGTDGTTTTYAPMYHEQTAMAAMLAGLSTDQLASAKLPDTFSDVLLGPGEDGQFPATKVGLAVSGLSDEQKALVVAAMEPWIQDVDDATAAAMMEIYESELDQTYIAYSGDPGLTSDADYVRIDGPSVWIEFVCQNGVVYSSQIHYHSVWRDHIRDYGAEYTFQSSL